MPCIACKRDTKLTSRILLDDLPLKTRAIFENEFFCNWEYSYICRRCYYSDMIRRARGNVLGLMMSLFLRYSMVYVASLVGYAFVVKQRYTGDWAHWGPIIFGVGATLVFFKYFFKIMMFTLVATMMVLVSIYAVAYSDTLSFLPEMRGVMERQRTQQREAKERRARRHARAKPTPAASSTAPSPSTTATKPKPTTPRRPTEDPVVRDERLRDERRQARIDYALRLLEKYIPLSFRLDFADLKAHARRSLHGFAILYGILIPLHFVIFPLYRLYQSRKRRRRTVEE